MDENNICVNDIKSIADIKIFPIINKEIIKDNYQEFIPTNINNIRGVKTSQTGGTTGSILFKRNDADTRSSIWGTYRRFRYDWMGIRDRDVKLTLMGGHIVEQKYISSLKKRINDVLYNKKSIDIYKTDDNTYNLIIDYLKNNKVKWIHGYSQFIYWLAKRMEAENIYIDVDKISTTAEPLLPEHRLIFKKVFNAEVFDQYGCGEIGGIAYECNFHNGLHISEERVILEVNENNEVIITDLDNFSMPFIRYYNADQIRLGQCNCECGRKSLLIKEIMGRTCDYIIGRNGQYLHWAYFWHLFFDSNVAYKHNLLKFQIVQENNIDICIKIIADKFSSPEEIFFKEDIIQRVGEMNIYFSYEQEIENSITGKYRPVINKLLIQ
jgi:phenylacetate-CoA ligase